MEIPRHNFTKLEKRIHSQNQITANNTLAQILRIVIREKIMDIFSGEKTDTIQRFAGQYTWLDSFYESFEVNKSTWQYNIALYQSNIGDNFLLRVEYIFSSSGSSVKKTVNYAFSDRIPFDNLRRKIEQLDWIEKEHELEHTKGCIVHELNNFSDPVDLIDIISR
ncbi:hypothetical protein K2X92_02400 [Candidatus Gracilibacteria bacterium]|nr:hypothetical protein [Candidatus Gracilibacteria bacterium]